MRKSIVSVLVLFSATISLAQKVGIGTTSPAYTLHVNSATGESSVGVNATGTASQALLNISIDNRSSGNSLLLLKYRLGVGGTVSGIPASNLSILAADAGAGALLISTNQSSPIYFATNFTERMRLSANGLLGINNTSPTSLLNIDGRADIPVTMNIYDNTSTGVRSAFSAGIQTTTGTSSAISGSTYEGVGVSGIEMVTYGLVGQSGNNGYAVAGYSTGSTAIRGKSGTGNALHTTGKVKLEGIGEAAGRVLTSDGLGNATWESLPASSGTWALNGAAIYNTNSGNVGINTITPSAKLTINNASSLTDAFRINHPTIPARITKVDGNGQLYHEGDFWVYSGNGIIRLGYPDKGWYWGTVEGGEDLQLWSHSTPDLSASNINRLYVDGSTGNVGINTNNNAAVYGKLIVDRNADLNAGLATYHGAITGLNSSTVNGSGLYGLSAAPRSGGQGYAGVSGHNTNPGSDRFGVIGISDGTSAGSVYSAGVGGYGDYGVLGFSQTTTGAGIIAQHNSGKTALEVNNGFIKVSGTNKTAFKHTTTVGNITTNWSTITYDSPTANDILIVTHNYSPSNTYLNKSFGVFWTGSVWAIYLEDLSGMPANIVFNVLVIRQ